MDDNLTDRLCAISTTLAQITESFLQLPLEEKDKLLRMLLGGAVPGISPQAALGFLRLMTLEEVRALLSVWESDPEIKTLLKQAGLRLLHRDAWKPSKTSDTFTDEL